MSEDKDAPEHKPATIYEMAKSLEQILNLTGPATASIGAVVEEACALLGIETAGVPFMQKAKAAHVAAAAYPQTALALCSGSEPKHVAEAARFGIRHSLYTTEESGQPPSIELDLKPPEASLPPTSRGGGNPHLGLVNRNRPDDVLNTR